MGELTRMTEEFGGYDAEIDEREGHRVPTPFIVVVDNNALFSLTLRDTLLRAAAAGFYQLRWSEVILDEMERNLVSTDTMSSCSAEARSPASTSRASR